jgi:hypothetical protein
LNSDSLKGGVPNTMFESYAIRYYHTPYDIIVYHTIRNSGAFTVCHTIISYAILYSLKGGVPNIIVCHTIRNSGPFTVCHTIISYAILYSHVQGYRARSCAPPMPKRSPTISTCRRGPRKRNPPCEPKNRPFGQATDGVGCVYQGI